jgi:acetyltransferase-like isoleucine patch superfamily enzyme
MENGFLRREQIEAIGFASVGEHVLIDSAARFYGASRISIGSNVRIDAFAVLSAGPGAIALGDYIHIAVGTTLIGAEHIEICSFANLSSRVAIYSSNDDYLGDGLTNPMVPEQYRKVDDAPVLVGRHVIIGTGSVVLPGVTLGMGAAVGSLSLVKADVPEFAIVAGTPARILGQRKRHLLTLERLVLGT